MPDASSTLETLVSLRRRGLIPAGVYQSRVDAHIAAQSQVPPRVVSPPWRVFSGLMAVIGCILAMPGVIVQEVQSGVPFVAAAVIEEALKLSGVYLLLLRWPQALSGRLHVAALCGLAGVTFGLIESLIYVTVYFPDEGSDFILFRFTVPVAMHVVASTVVGLGLSRGIFDWAAGRTPFPRRTRNFFFAGAALHLLYNVSVIVLALSGELEFD